MQSSSFLAEFQSADCWYHFSSSMGIKAGIRVKRVFLLSNLPVEMPVDHLIEFNDLMPDRLEMELIRTGDLPLTPPGLEKMRPDLGYAGASARKLFQSDRSKASDPKRLLTQLPTLVRTTVQIATFKAGNERKTTHRHLYLPKDYSGSPTSQPLHPVD